MAIPWKKIIEIIIFILTTIGEGLSESQAIKEASLKSGVSVSKVKNIWKSYKKR